jgi:hypothetical protein
MKNINDSIDPVKVVNLSAAIIKRVQELTSDPATQQAILMTAKASIENSINQEMVRVIMYQTLQGK